MVAGPRQALGTNLVTDANLNARTRRSPMGGVDGGVSKFGGEFGVWIIAASLVRVDPTGSPVRDGPGVSLGMFCHESLVHA
jgi:hypothetical protein